MAQTVQGLKDFFNSTGTNPPITNAQLSDMADWLTGRTGLDGPATPDDLVDYIYTMFKQQVISHKRASSSPRFG